MANAFGVIRSKKAVRLVRKPPEFVQYDPVIAAQRKRQAMKMSFGKRHSLRRQP